MTPTVGGQLLGVGEPVQTPACRYPAPAGCGARRRAPARGSLVVVLLPEPSCRRTVPSVACNLHSHGSRYNNKTSIFPVH
jgi:hypothetical protein